MSVASPATTLFAQLLAGIQHPNHADDETPTFALADLVSDGRSVQAKLVVPSGDRYLVTVEWLSEDSP